MVIKYDIKEYGGTIIKWVDYNFLLNFIMHASREIAIIPIMLSYFGIIRVLRVRRQD